MFLNIDSFTRLYAPQIQMLFTRQEKHFVISKGNTLEPCGLNSGLIIPYELLFDIMFC